MNAQNKLAPIDRKAIIEQCFTAYNAKDRATIEELLTSTFTFTSPYDNAIDRATYFETVLVDERSHSPTRTRTHLC